jgi:hypothetical protein
MDSIRIETGIKRIAINDDPERVIEFNPTDVLFAEKFYNLIRAVEKKEVEYLQRANEVVNNQSVDDNGIPENLESGISLLREVCEFVRGEIDKVFGSGTSQKAFGDTYSFDVFEQFLDGITPFIKSSRSQKTAQYIKQNKNHVMK